MPSRRLRRNVRHPCEEPPERRTIYLDTVAWASTNPSSRSSPWMRGALPRGFSWFIYRIKSRSSRSILGRPTGPRDFQRQRARYPALCQPITVSGLTIATAFKIPGHSRYSKTNSARSEPRNSTDPDILRRSTLSWWRRNVFSAQSCSCERNQSLTQEMKSRSSAIIKPIISRFLNPWQISAGSNIRKGQLL
jgi:hypothetical protein